MTDEPSGTSGKYDRAINFAQLTATQNVIGLFRLALTFGGNERARSREGTRQADAEYGRSREVEALRGLTASEVDAIKDAVIGAAGRIEKARQAGETMVSRTSALSVTFVWLTVAVVSVYALPEVRPYSFAGSVAVFVAALGASLLGAVLFLLSLPPVPRIPTASQPKQRIKLYLDVLPDWALFLFVVWLYISSVARALDVVRSPDRHSWMWEVLLAGAAIPFSALLGVVAAVLLAAVVEGRREAQQARYVVNDVLVLVLLDLAWDAQRAIDLWYEPKGRRLLSKRLESAAQRIEVSFSRSARAVHGPTAGRQIREQGQRIAAALRRHEWHITLASGPSDVARVRDALCSGLVAAVQGDWPSLSGVEPGSAVRSFLARLWPRLGPFLLFGGAAALLLWLSRDERWASLALAGAIPLGISAVLSIISPSNEVTKRAQEVLDNTFSPLWRP